MPDIKVDVTIIGQTRDEVGTAYDATIDWSAGSWVLEETILPGTEETMYSSLNRPQQLATRASDQMIYAADYGNNRLVRLAATGTTLSTSITSLTSCTGVCLDASSNVYVGFILSGNYVVRKYNSAHTLLWTSATLPVYGGIGGHLATDGTSVFVTGLHRVIVLNASTGAITTTWAGSGQYWALQATYGSLGSGDANFSNPDQIATDAAGNIYVADSTNSRLKKHNSSGTFISPAITSLSTIRGVCLDASGNIYVTYSTDNIRKYNSSLVLQWTATDPGFDSLVHITTDGTYLYVTNQSLDVIGKFNASTGAFVANLGTSGTGNGQFSNPYGIVYNSVTGTLFVVDTGNNRVQEITTTGTYVEKWGIDAGGAGICVDASGDLVVACTTASTITRYTPAGVVIDTIYQQASPYGVAIGPGDVLWVGSQATDNIAKWDEAAGFAPGAGNGYFNKPWGIAQDGTHVYVVDSGNNRVQKLLKSDGSYVAQWEIDGGGTGCNMGGANLMVLETEARIVKRFTTAGVFVDSFRTGIPNRGVTMNTLNNSIWVSDNIFDVGFGLGKWNLVGGKYRRLFTMSDPTAAFPDWAGGYIYFVDWAQQRLVKMTSEGNLVWHTGGDGYDDPSGISIGPNGHIYFCGIDDGNYWFYIVEYGPEREWIDDGWMDPASGNYWIGGVTVGASAGWMSTAYNDGTTAESYVEEFSLSSLVHTGDYIPDGDDSNGSAPGQFHYPWGLTNDVEFIYVADTENNRIQKLTFDASHPAFVTQWSAPNVVNLSIDLDGYILYGDVDTGQVTRSTKEGATVEVIQSLPGVDAAVMDEKGQIWVLNSDNPRIEKWVMLQSPLPVGATDPDGMEFLIETGAGLSTEQIRDEIRDAAIARLNQEPGFAQAALQRGNVRVDGFTNTGGDDIVGPVPLTWYSGAAITPAIPGVEHTPQYISPIQVLKSFNVTLNDDLKEDLMNPIIYLDQAPNLAYYPEYLRYELQGWNGTTQIWSHPLESIEQGFVLTARIDLQLPEQAPLWNTNNVWLRLTLIRTSTGISIPAGAAGRITSGIVNFQKL